ncbi:hypothetical protein [uncultured Chitinophaga sp.]|nr:hypothetical protein [uncultured Chitinophaga sp.]
MPAIDVKTRQTIHRQSQESHSCSPIPVVNAMDKRKKGAVRNGR